MPAPPCDVCPINFFLLNSQSKQEQAAGLGVGCSSEKLFELFELAKSRRIKQQCNLRGWYAIVANWIVTLKKTAFDRNFLALFLFPKASLEK